MSRSTAVALGLLAASAIAAALAPETEQPPYAAHVQLSVCATPDLHHCFASTPGSGGCPEGPLRPISIADAFEEWRWANYNDPARTVVACRGDCAGAGTVSWELVPSPVVPRDLRVEIAYTKAGDDTADVYDAVTLTSAQPRQERSLREAPRAEERRWPYGVRVFEGSANQPIACVDPDIFIHRP